MVLSVLFGRKYARAQVGVIAIDATLSEDHEYTARVTSFPVENGELVSDHIINEPEKLNLVGLVTDTPLNILLGFNRSITAFNRLIDIHRNKEIVTVVTGIKVYTNMVMTSLNVPRDLSTGQSLTFNMQFQKILLDSSTRLILNQNNPFNRQQDIISREQVANASKYPFIQNDPVTSLKDQAMSGIDVGIQDLLPVPTNALSNIYASISRIKGLF